ncbi:MAG: NAD(P)-dependent oxidoreductase [Solirubrobacteraceae bacterium]
MSDARVVAVLGAGALGAAMAARLGELGNDVRLWNRTPERARAGAASAAGVVAVETTAEATLGAAAIITVLRDGGAVASVMATAIAEMPGDAVWVQASTVGPRSAEALADLARAHGVAYLDAPVSGSTTPAREGRLVWLVAGEDAALERARPVLEALGSSVLHVGTGVEGSALKLAVNAWMTAATVAMSDVLALCDALGVDHATFVRALEAGPLAMPYELQKVGVMDAGTYTAGFAVELALKDINLAAELAEPSPLLKVVHDRLERASSAGHGGDDVAAVDYARRQT